MSLRVCVDASLAVRWIAPTERDDVAESLLATWDQTATELVGPPLFDAEVTSAIRKLVYFKKLMPQQGEDAFLLYRGLDVRIVDRPELPEIAWALAKEFNQVQTYDMQYLAVAEIEDCEFWTADRKLINSLRGKNERVRWLGEAAGDS